MQIKTDRTTDVYDYAAVYEHDCSHHGRHRQKQETSSMNSILRMVTALALLAGLMACGSSTDTGTSASGGVTQLQTQDLRIGNGTEATNGKTLSVRYTGWL